MIDFAGVFLSLALSIVGGFFGVMFGVWFTKRYMFSPQNLMEMADSVLDYAVNTKEGQEKLNILGQWVMKNISGLIQGNVKGAMPKPKDLIGIILMGLVQKYLPALNPQTEQQQQPPAQNAENQRYNP